MSGTDALSAKISGDAFVPVHPAMGENFARRRGDDMNRARRPRSLALLVLLAIVACARAPRDTPTPPPAPVAPPPAEVSTFSIPIRTNLGALASQIESQVPPQVRGTVRERGIDVEYVVARDPIRLTANPQSIHASSTIHYALQACRGRFPCISCGMAEPRRTAEIKLQSTLSWSTDWRLHSSTRVLPVHYNTACAITWFDIDVTRRFVAPVVERELAKIASTIDRQTPRLTNIRPRAETIWRSLQEPVEIAPRTWLLIEPQAVALTPPGGNGNALTTTLHLRTLTRVAVGDRPAVTPRSLAPLSNAPKIADPKMRVPLDLQLPWPEATRLAMQHYAGRTLQINGRPLTVRALDIAPLPQGRVRIHADIDYRGGTLRNYEGPVVLEGTARFDAATSRIVIPDLDYSLESRRGFLARLAERAVHNDVRSRLRETVHLDLGKRLADARTNITKALHRPLAPGVRLQGTVRSIGVNDLIVHPDALYLRLIAEGEAIVDIAVQ